MTAVQKIALAIDPRIHTDVRAQLAAAGITLGNPVGTTDRLRCYHATGGYVDETAAREQFEQQRADAHPELTANQLRMLDLLAEGHGWRQIADRFGISHDMVRYRAKKLFDVLGARDRAHAVLLACRAGLIGGAE